MKILFILASVTVFLFFAEPVQGQTSKKIQDINKKVVGKWWCCDQKSYLEFLPNGACSEGTFYEGKWHVEQASLSAWERGKEFYCISGALTLIAQNTLTRDIGMGGVITRYYREVQKSRPVQETSICTFCGVWEYTDYGSKLYLKISQAGTNKFKLVTGFIDLAGQIEWSEPEIKKANGIYLTPLGGKLTGKFVSSNFLPTHGRDFTYRITVSRKSDNKIAYSVWYSGGRTDNFVAIRISD